MTENSVDALSHFGGGFVGEGNGENGVGSDAFFLNKPGDAAGNDAGFAGAGAGQDEQGAFSGLDGGALFGIQFVDKRLQDARPGGKGSFLLVYCLGRQRNGNGSRDDQRPRSQLREEWPFEMHNLSKIDKLCILI